MRICFYSHGIISLFQFYLAQPPIGFFDCINNNWRRINLRNRCWAGCGQVVATNQVETAFARTPITKLASKSFGTKAARVVLTHSTFCEGLLPVLDKLSNVEGIHTITPARLFRFKGRRDQFELSVKSQTSNGFRLLGRRGMTAQEVFCVTSLDQETLNRAIQTIVQKENGKGSTPTQSKSSLTRRQMRRMNYK